MRFCFPRPEQFPKCVVTGHVIGLAFPHEESCFDVAEPPQPPKGVGDAIGEDGFHLTDRAKVGPYLG